MEAKTFELLKCKDGQHSLVLYMHKSGKVEFVVCSFFDPERIIGSQWEWGHYFDDFYKVIRYMLDKKYVTLKDIMLIDYTKADIELHKKHEELSELIKILVEMKGENNE